MLLWIILIVLGLLVFTGVIYFADTQDEIVISIDKDSLGDVVDDVREALPIEVKLKDEED